LVPVFAIRTESDLGIGDTSGVKEMVDWLAKIGMKFLQVLPINEMAGDNSPYNAISSVAIEPTTLDVSPKKIPELREEDYNRIIKEVDLAALRSGAVDYKKVRRLKSDLLWSAFHQFQNDPAIRGSKRETEFLEFCQKESGWLQDYCTFRVFMDMEGGSENWETWSERYNTIDKARAHLQKLLSTAPDQARMQQAYYAYVQFLAHNQWADVASYAAGKGVHLMGDVPFGLSRCSADVFSEPQWFDLDWCGGAPPETNFKDDEFVVRWGQNWGIPNYRWDRMAEDGFKWWKRRIAKLCETFDIFRIDHVLGFYRIYSFPWRPERNSEFLHLGEDEVRAKTGGRMPGFLPRPDDTDENQRMNQEEGEKYLSAIAEAAGDSEIVAEDLGMVPPYVPGSLNGLGMSGMRVPMWETQPDGEFNVANSYTYLTLATYATHDHEPMKTQWERHRQIIQNSHHQDEVNAAWYLLHRLARFAKYPEAQGDPVPPYSDAIREALLRELFAASSKYAAVMITDLLGLEDRFNVPGTLSEGNWSRRLEMTVSDLDRDPRWAKLGDQIHGLLKETGRA
tara:strand:- start:847 stop:2541 length:1695 start_codon:yes stop_codon:yes gene_type:complete